MLLHNCSNLKISTTNKRLSVIQISVCSNNWRLVEWNYIVLAYWLNLFRHVTMKIYLLDIPSIDKNQAQDFVSVWLSLYVFVHLRMYPCMHYVSVSMWLCRKVYICKCMCGFMKLYVYCVCYVVEVTFYPSLHFLTKSPFPRYIPLWILVLDAN